jgi:hypothetical protein
MGIDRVPGAGSSQGAIKAADIARSVSCLELHNAYGMGVSELAEFYRNILGHRRRLISASS